MLPGAHQVNLKPLLGPAQKLLVVTALQVFLQRGRRAQIHAAPSRHARYQQMLFDGHSCVLVIHHFPIPVEGQAELHVATHPVDSTRLVRRSLLRQAVRQGARRIRLVQQMNNALCRSDRRDRVKRSDAIEEEH